MRSVEEALESIAGALGAYQPQVEHVPLVESLGRVVAEPVRMDHDVPPFRRAAMDGFALAVPLVTEGARFRVEQSVMAGDLPHAPLRAEGAARVMTGAPVPEGALCVVPFEWTREEQDEVIVERVPRPPIHIVEQGEHVQEGAVVVEPCTIVTPAVLGALASAGCAQVPVRRRPSVALLGTGSELVPVDHQPGPGAIRNSNNAALWGQTLRAGGAPVDLGIVEDDETSLRASIRRGLDHDLLLLSGGVSRGDKDLVPGCLEAEGVRCLFHRWAVQPGGPIWVGVKDATLVFGLPGNPAGAFTGFEVLAVPVIRARLGCGLGARRTLRARYEGPWGKPGPRRRFRPVRLECEPTGTLVARACAWRGSGDPFGLAAGDALAILPEGSALEPGDSALVEVLPLHEAALVWGTA